MPDCVFVIDGNALSCAMIRSILESRHICHTFSSWSTALPHLAAQPPDLLLLDIALPDEDGFSVVSRFKSDTRFQDIPLIIYTARSNRHHEARSLALGAVDFISKSAAAETMLARVNIHLELRRRRRHLETLVREKTRMVERLQVAIMASLSDLEECRDADTSDHARRIVSYLRGLLAGMARHGLYAARLTPQFLRNVIRAGPLYDLGKVGVSDLLLRKPGRLTPEEYELVKRHTLLGGRAIQRAIDTTQTAGFLLMVRDIILTHHERWDGTGYPCGLRGEEIPLAGRITALVDVYDALRHARPYRDALSHPDAVEIIRRHRGTHFDPAIADVFLDMHETFARLAEAPDVTGPGLS